MSEGDSTLPRRQLGRHLRDARLAIGMTLVEAAGLMQWSKSSLQRLEKGQIENVRTHDIAVLCEIYQLPPDETADLIALAEQTAVKNWWQKYGALISPNFDVYMGLESSARELASFQPCSIPGLLQTPDYARSLDRLYFPDNTEEQLDKRVELRVRRQGVILHKIRPASLAVIFHESAIRTVVGSKTLMAAQDRHLADLSTRPNIDIRILPFRAGLPVGMSTGPFTILSFGQNKRGEPLEPTLVYAEAFTGAMYFEDGADVDKYREAYATIQRAALDTRPSRDLLREVAREFERER
ncbi:helix-turn-helix domain-containing protein [Nocardia transvalensis]|uniref:helix-turn-helix domain-containing protein n=1 Tax=Nocardia transvalensis TaxID=37333 RepID=UPI001894217B|nr:helix-turn-helix transcriptional regulator [Nocardia transvalensis]MBF6329096.1 helix-turn-helix domain-containing protein [Nocardia transvalensis]